jgi:hypothetical protein
MRPQTLGDVDGEADLESPRIVFGFELNQVEDAGLNRNVLPVVAF